MFTDKQMKVIIRNLTEAFAQSPTAGFNGAIDIIELLVAELKDYEESKKPVGQQLKRIHEYHVSRVEGNYVAMYNDKPLVPFRLYRTDDQAWEACYVDYMGEDA